jgi:DNA-binding NarL/FixJ family response regulator
MAKQKQFDFIILDINLPDKSGLHCIKDLKKYNKGAKIFILSAYDDQETIQQCLKEGADRILQKPLT